MLLAIDTSTRFASIALYGPSGIVSEASWHSRNNHSRQVLPAIQAMLARQELVPADLSGVAVAKGPGSFTGLRIGLSIAKGLALSLDIPIVAIPTLDILAYALGDPGCDIYAVLEAGRGRLSVARYVFDGGLPEALGDPTLVWADQWTIQGDAPAVVTGEVSADVAERLLSDPDSNLTVTSLAGSLRRAGYLAELAWERIQDDDVDNLDGLSPTYLHYPSSGTID